MAGAIIAVFIVLVIILLATNIRIVPQAHSFVIEELGAYKETWDVGLHFKIPFIDRVASITNIFNIFNSDTMVSMFSSFKKIFIYLFRLCQVLVPAHSIIHLHCSMLDL